MKEKLITISALAQKLKLINKKTGKTSNTYTEILGKKIYTNKAYKIK